MFTGLIQAVARVVGVAGDRILVTAPDFVDLELGESIAVNGACLTLVPSDTPGVMSFDVSPETFDRTNLGRLSQGSLVNLERAMTVGTRIGGHIVQGHVDATGTLTGRKASGEFEIFRFQGPSDYDRYLIDKGSVAVDGISLTVVEPVAGAFDVWVVPHTLANTNLAVRESGDQVNLEYDQIAKYLEKLAQLSKVR